jgi:ubiquinone/menaquinone biosynthesis C-methylase UbiE
MQINLGTPSEHGIRGVDKKLNLLNSIYKIRFNNGIDFGAGKGAYSKVLINHIKHIVAIDIVKESLLFLNDEIENDEKIDCVVTSATKLCLKSNRFESLFAIEVLDHLDSLSDGMNEIKRITNDGAVVYVTVPNKYFPLETHMVNIFGKSIKGKYVPFLSWFDSIHNKIGTARRFSISQLKILFEQHGFTLVGYNYMMPPFDYSKIGKYLISPFTRLLEKTFLKVFGVTILAVFKKTA